MRKTIAVSVTAASLAVAVLFGQGTASWVGVAHAAQPTGVPMQVLPDFSQLVEANGPAVVNISTVQRAPAPGAEAAPGDPADSLNEFFRRFGVPTPEGRPTPREGVGSGFIITPDGFILTNAHVVADAGEVNVRLTDKREFRAKVIGSDRRTDVAVIKIDATNLPAVRIGNADTLKVGEWVAAIGSPFGLENTVTAGIVSAKSRVLEGYVPFLQTDVAINPGNSGGPLFNMAGEVVGINSQIYSRTGGYMGLSFAVPIDVAIKVKDDLVRFGKVERGRIGVVIQSVNRDLADSFGLDRARGALISSVEAGSPAQKAGLQAGDIILNVNGRTIEESTELPRIVGDTRPGTSLPLQIWRKGAQQGLKVEVGAMPDDKVAGASPARETQPTGALGLGVRPLTDAERKRAGVPGGLLVERADGPAARAGIQRGDVILALNNQDVRTVEDLKRIAEKLQGNVAVLVKREDARLYLPLRVG
jgi:serine protease Do